MTREQIENMPAGDEMDAEITKLLYPDAKVLIVYDGYSTDLKMAWLLKEDLGFPISLIESMLGGSFSCEFLIDLDAEKIVEAKADTAPLAICRAYLLYKMEEE